MTSARRLGDPREFLRSNSGVLRFDVGLATEMYFVLDDDEEPFGDVDGDGNVVRLWLVLELALFRRS